MSEVFFIGDTHFGHRGILKYEQEKRPFSCLEEMREYMIQEWNKVVSSEDKVYHLGDFCFGKENIHIAGRLNGKKYLILGNHDTYDTNDYLQYFRKVFGAFQFESCILTHIPVCSHQLEKRFWANIHGHYHSKEFPHTSGQYLNVSCENLPNLAPITYGEVVSRITDKYGYNQHGR